MASEQGMNMEQYDLADIAQVNDLVNERNTQSAGHRPTDVNDRDMTENAGEEEYRAEEEDMQLRLQSNGEHISLAEAEAAGDDDHGEGEGRQHEEDHEMPLEAHDRLHILAEHSVDASHGPPPSMAEQLDRQHLQHAGDLLSFASLGAGPSGDADGFGRIFADQAHEQTTEAEMGEQTGIHDEGDYQVDLNTEGYPTQNAGEGEMFEAGQSGQDGLQGMEMNEMGPDQNVGGSRKRKRKTPKTLDQSEIELKKAAHKEIERKRRHNIAAGVDAIAGILPNGDKEKYKGQILFRAVDYIQQLQRDTGRLPDLEAREKQLTEHLEKATANMPGFQAARIEELERENQTLREESGENLRKWAEEKVTLDEELISLRARVRTLESMQVEHVALTEEYHRNWRNEENRATNLLADVEKLKVEARSR